MAAFAAMLPMLMQAAGSMAGGEGEQSTGIGWQIPGRRRSMFDNQMQTEQQPDLLSAYEAMRRSIRGGYNV